MQGKPNSRLFRWTIGGLVAVVAVGVVWAIIAGAGGYTLGSPPTGLDAVASCYQVTRVDFVVPMWKATDPVDCGQTASDTTSPSSAPAAPAPALRHVAGTCSGQPCTLLVTPSPPAAASSSAPPVRVCDDPNWRTDGNASGEEPCP
jgi:hypothetical protein